MLLIFDWDGTLSDSKGRITLAMQRAIADLGWGPLADHQVHNIIGLGLPEAVKVLFPEADSQGHEQLRMAYRVRYTELDERPADLFPGVLDALVHLRDQGHRLAIATGKSRQGLDRILHGLGLVGLFEASRCADETASKPHPLMLEELLADFGQSAAEAVMVGDTEYDMDMARRIAMPRIAVSYGAHHVDRLKPYAPELCLDAFDQILAWERLADR